MYTAERHFVRTARNQMQILETGPAVPMLSHMVPVLDEIKAAAMQVEARGVFRAAGLCQDVISRTGMEDTSKLSQSLVGLNSLICQYSAGLFEIDPEFKARFMGNTNDLATELFPLDSVETSGIDVDAKATGLASVALKLRLKDQHESAIDTLKPLMHLVENDTQLSALKTLMRPVANDVTSQPELANPIAQHRTVKFENLMRPITNLILSEARYSAKSVSISYAADFDELALELADHIQAFLEVLCLNIVINGIGDKASQISLTGQERDRRYRFYVNWSGSDMASSAEKNSYFRSAVADLKAIGGAIKFRSLALKNEMTGQAEGKPTMQALEISFPLTIPLAIAPKIHANLNKNTDTKMGTKSMPKGNFAKVGGASR